MRAFVALLFALVVACSSAPAPTRCTPGASVACVCPGVGTGAQVCAADGASYGACACGVDAGGRVDAADAGSGCVPGSSAFCSCGGVPGAMTCGPAREYGTCACDAGSPTDIVDVVDVGPRVDTDPRCAEAGAAPAWCPSGAGACVDLQSDIANCGACGTRCPAPFTECFRGSCFLPIDASVDAAR